MQVNRSSVSATRTGSIRMDPASTGVAPAPVDGVVAMAAADDSLSDGTPRPPLTLHRGDEDDLREALIDAIDPDLAYRAAVSVLRRRGMVGLLLNRNA